MGRHGLVRATVIEGSRIDEAIGLPFVSSFGASLTISAGTVEAAVRTPAMPFGVTVAPSLGASFIPTATATKGDGPVEATGLPSATTGLRTSSATLLVGTWCRVRGQVPTAIAVVFTRPAGATCAPVDAATISSSIDVSPASVRTAGVIGYACGGVGAFGTEGSCTFRAAASATATSSDAAFIGPTTIEGAT